MIKTCGVLFIDKNNNILICRATNSNNFSIPKGLNEEGESDIDTAAREVKEETGLLIDPKKLIYFDSSLYKNKKKTLFMFIYKLDYINEKEMHCDSFFEMYGKTFPENDLFLKINICDYDKYNIHATQKLLIKKYLELN